MSIQKALNAAMNGPEVKDINVFGHDWNVKKATVDKSGSTVNVKGQISHNVRFSKDDQIFYDFVFENGKVVKSDIKIDEAGWASIVGRVASVVTGGAVSDSDVSTLANKVENMAHGDWQTAGKDLALRIALEGYKTARN